ncbi:hemolysin III family protein [Microcella daejeonensis]|uniref:Hemolysin III family protein n=1 Tax=Microcella daejeonensis TaxID=2994971 RepID=A0A9E8SAE2_9MICO|nr:hemolysin III family protein [Microcella daejeonensis]WAB80572.1 hemolysin III family protein [Microcella daejeonensis]
MTSPDSDIDREPGTDLPNVPLLEESIEYAALDAKPTWRGWIHAGTFPVALVAGIVLLIVADGAAATWSSAVFMTTSLLLFGISATYHRFTWSDRTRILLKRLDHANIFLLIAGTYTPLAVLALPPDKGYLLLGLVWAGAALGIGFRVFWIGAPRWAYVPLYLLLGWAAVLYMGDLFAADAAMMVLVIAGGLAYTAGAVIYGMKKPNPVPGIFGFHEIFHALTVIAFLCHWTGILLVAIDPPFGG